jgi:hypothetical protein
MSQHKNSIVEEFLKQYVPLSVEEIFNSLEEKENHIWKLENGKINKYYIKESGEHSYIYDYTDILKEESFQLKFEEYLYAIKEDLFLDVNEWYVFPDKTSIIPGSFVCLRHKTHKLTIYMDSHESFLKDGYLHAGVGVKDGGYIFV